MSHILCGSHLLSYFPSRARALSCKREMGPTQNMAHFSVTARICVQGVNAGMFVWKMCVCERQSEREGSHMCVCKRQSEREGSQMCSDSEYCCAFLQKKKFR